MHINTSILLRIYYWLNALNAQNSIPIDARVRLNDLLAGAMLTNGFIWSWMIGLRLFPTISGNLDVRILTYLSFMMYLLSSYVSSYFVCKRVSRGHLIISLKLTFLSWIFSVILMFLVYNAPSIGLSLSLLASFFMGDIAGAYMILRLRLRSQKD